MNKYVKDLIVFISGTAVGAVSTFIFVKDYYKTIADEEIKEVRKVYEDKLGELEPHSSSLDGKLEGPNELPGDKKLSHKEIVERLNNKPDITDYSKFFKPKGEKIDGVTETLRDAKEAADSEGLSEEELAEMESPEDDEPYTDEEDREEQLAYDDHTLNGEHKKAVEEGRSPYEIEPSDYELTCANYDKISLIFYHFDQIVTNEEGETIDEGRLIGNIIEESGFNSNEDDVMYVRNDVLMCDFEITKVYEAYGSSLE